MTTSRIYLDNAATSWPKPEAVYQAVDEYQRRGGASAGRGVYREAVAAQQLVDDTRRRVAQLLGSDDPRRVVFTGNGTDSLNLALHGSLRPGDHVLTTVVEHNSVLRPLRWLQETRAVEVSYVPCDGQGLVDPQEFRRGRRRNTKALVITHASNVTGALQPVEELGQWAKGEGLLLILDAAQSLGHVEVNVQRLHCQLLAAPAHKGLLGPLGLGVLYIAPGVESLLLPQRQGGTGSQSENELPPDFLPDRYEAGNLNVLAIAGLREGVRYLSAQGLEQIRRHEQQLTTQLLEGLSTPEVQCYGPPPGPARVGVVSVNLAGYSPQEAAATLDAGFGIQTRAGLHCAPRIHDAVGSARQGGTLRFSFGPFNTPQQVEQTLAALHQMVNADHGIIPSSR